MSRATIRRFVVAGQFIEVLRCFENGMTEEVNPMVATATRADRKMEQKLQYARWKAADGAKALREGRTPTSGPRESARRRARCRPLTNSYSGTGAGAGPVPYPSLRGPVHALDGDIAAPTGLVLEPDSPDRPVRIPGRISDAYVIASSSQG